MQCPGAIVEILRGPTTVNDIIKGSEYYNILQHFVLRRYLCLPQQRRY